MLICLYHEYGKRSNKLNKPCSIHFVSWRNTTSVLSYTFSFGSSTCCAEIFTKHIQIVIYMIFDMTHCFLLTMFCWCDILLKNINKPSKLVGCFGEYHRTLFFTLRVGGINYHKYMLPVYFICLNAVFHVCYSTNLNIYHIGISIW